MAALQTKNQKPAVLKGLAVWRITNKPKRSGSSLVHQQFYFEPRVGIKVRIVGLHNNKQTNKQTNRGGAPLIGPQEELGGPSGYTPRGFTSLPGVRRVL